MNNVIQFPNRKQETLEDYLEECQKLDTQRRILATKGLAKETIWMPWVLSVIGLILLGWSGFCAGFILGYVFRAFLLSTMRYGREL